MRVKKVTPSSIHQTGGGSLFVVEGANLPFEIKRTFIVKARKGEVRGEHAHWRCSQMLLAVNGRVQLKVFDGVEWHEFLLENLEQGIVIPPLHWAVQRYLDDNSILLVHCDREFDENEYIRVFDDFRRATAKAGIKEEVPRLSESR